VSVSAAWRQRLDARWSALAPRDQRALWIGGIALAVILPVLLAWRIHDGLAARRMELAESRALVADAGRRVAARLAVGADITTDTAGGAAGGAATQARVARAAARAGIDAASMTIEPLGSDRLRLGLRDAPYEALTTLLGALARWEGITVVSADIARTGPGRVEAALVLRAP